MYNEFRMDYLPKIYDWNEGKILVIKINIRLNKILEKENGWNKETKDNYNARVYIFQNICADISMGQKPTAREKIMERLNKKVDQHLMRRKLINKKTS
jgi:hypothetical protein